MGAVPKLGYVPSHFSNSIAPPGAQLPLYGGWVIDIQNCNLINVGGDA